MVFCSFIVLRTILYYISLDKKFAVCFILKVMTSFKLKKRLDLGTLADNRQYVGLYSNKLYLKS